MVTCRYKMKTGVMVQGQKCMDNIAIRLSFSTVCVQNSYSKESDRSHFNCLEKQTYNCDQMFFEGGGNQNLTKHKTGAFKD